MSCATLTQPDRPGDALSANRSRSFYSDWERYLTEFPDAADHDKVKRELRRVRQKLARLN